ncbi:MAG: class I SAM-dependent methyltransferase [Stenotrophobium sp.]
MARNTETSPMNASFTCPFCQGQTFTTVQSQIRDWEFGVAGSYAYRQCDGCGHLHLWPFPNVEALKLAYPPAYSAHVDEASDRGWLYRILYALNLWLFRRRFGQHIGPGSRVADIGCGNGEFLQTMRSFGVSRCVGIDFSEEACAKARAKGIEAFCGLYVDYPELEPFDAVFMNNYLEHVLDPVSEIAKTYQLLRPGGGYYGELPNWDSWDRRLFGRYWGGNHVPRHTYQFTPRLLQACLARSGFQNIRIHQEPNPSVLLLSLQNWRQRHVRDLANNPRLQCGRMSGFSVLMLVLLPFNALACLFGKSGIIKFEAIKPKLPGAGGDS